MNSTLIFDSLLVGSTGSGGGDTPNKVVMPGTGGQQQQHMASLDELDTLYGNDEILMMSKKQQQLLLQSHQQQMQQPSGLPAFVDLENFSRSLDGRHNQAHKLNNLYLLKLLAPLAFILISILFIYLVS
jgi:hypothetical protein